ncbi:MAG: TAT-variant-translocated molybdopterin oxidoreductase [Myxococcales bacterium]|nr:TAT-variant-translocated molybdopterin oxidoreductase [Myxococcales bacterium]
MKSTDERRLWRSIDELQQNEAFEKARADEFAEATEAPEMDGSTRRHFLGVVGASVAMASMAGCVRRPEDHIVPYSRAPEEFLPGVKQHFATATHVGGNVIGLLVESHEGRPTKIEGNPDHPSSFGKASGVHQGLVLNLYDPTRARVPQKGKAPTSWEAASDFVRSHFRELLARQGRGLAFVSESTPSPTIAHLKRRIRATFPEATWHTYEPVSEDSQREGLKASFDLPVRARYELNMATTVLALDSDFLGSEGDTVANAYRWAQTRKIENEQSGMSRLYAVEGRFSVTGTNADHRLRLPTSRIEQFAWALVEEVGKLGGAFPILVSQAAPGITAGLDPKVRKFAAVAAEDLMSQKGAGEVHRFGLVIAGRRTSPVVHALTSLINLAIGSQGKTVTYFPDPRRADDEAGDMASIKALTESLQAGKVDTLVVLGGNPVYTAPGDLGFAEAFKKAKTTIALSDHVDETARLATWTLPRAHFLETWGDWVATDGTVTIQQPLIAPLHGAWSEIELLARVLGEDKVDGYSQVRGFWQGRMGGPGFHKKWRRWLHDGVLDTPLFGSVPVYKKPQGLGSLQATPATDLPTARSLEVVFVEDANLYDGRFANNSWLQEAPDPITKVTWDNTIAINMATAEALNVESEDRADLSVGGQQIAGVIWVTPGIADGTAVVTLGYGRDFDGYLPYHDEGKVGFDVNPLRQSGSPNLLAGGKLTKKAGKYPVACVQRYGSQEPGFGYAARPLVREETVEGFQKNPTFAKPGILEHGKAPPKAVVVHPEAKSIYPDWDYSQGHQWGMSIDLNTCTGCNACLVACVSENNIMPVGKDQVRRGRELHWIRMDRYFVGKDDDVQVVHQPMGCQQCETAPCENVCPVAATTHSPEGLNDMAYNRCIGTRYCANNCPFKVRRFNFYNYSKGQDELVHMQRNPNVTVRFRGVMEKCTYCTQRINMGKRQARMASQQGREEEARQLIGAITPACQQTCPTDAIVFGDINDKTSRVAKLKAQSRDYQLLSELNLHPRTSYLAKVRNPNPKLVG